jgi:hypothetical protein
VSTLAEIAEIAEIIEIIATGNVVFRTDIKYRFHSHRIYWYMSSTYHVATERYRIIVYTAVDEDN